MTPGSQPIDPMLKLFSEISGMSPDRRVQHYLHVLLVRKETRLRFQLVGNLVMAQEAIRFPNGIVLEPQPTRRKLTRRISQMSADEIRQQITERVYVIDGSVDSDVWKTGQIAERVTGIVEQIERTVILLSFLCGAKLGWAPAQLALDRNGSSVLAPVPIKSRDYVHADEAHVGSLVALSRLVENLSPRVRVDVYRAMDWYQQGVKSASPFNSFLSFWSAIETTARSLHPKLRDKSGKTQIIHAFASAFDREAAKARVEQCIGETGSGKVGVGQHLGNKESYIHIRNDIAHGNISEADVGQKHRVEDRLLEIERLAREFLLRTLRMRSYQVQN